jgi:hypothetical protein
LNLFKDIIPSLLQGRAPLIQDENDAKDYVPFMVNKALSYYLDCIFFANLMNECPHLTRIMQHDFYFYGLRKYKRSFPGKWVKKVEEDKTILELIMRDLKCSYQDAIDTLPLLNDEQIVKLQEQYIEGGKL